ncbi:acyl-CoA dehydrogenase/oxidase [Triangularia setosa]|uniref:Acyl-CoA dehydrogenase/oxidase n=1 Tax=Triangularia setosa TaxID=2587417 RepID=A0AAN7AAW9_9PEZI|nr:acyl-CoA dehydrogenase/oxidase [Podospora setosa]
MTTPVVPVIRQAPTATDPAVYAEYEPKWATYPSDAQGWLERAREVATVLSVDAAAREKANKSPRAEVALLKHSGLLKVLGPKKYGGGEQPWGVGYKVIREVAKGDGSIGMLLGYHLLWSRTAHVVGNDEQAERFQKLIIENNYYVGGAVNPRDNDLKITYDDFNITYNGFKNFTTGAAVSDLIVLEGAIHDRPEEHIFAIVPTAQAGIQFHYNWDNVGLRLTESGSAKIEGISASWDDALGWDVATKKPDPAVLGIAFPALLLPTIQLVFSNFYLGIALGALDFAKKYTTTSTRAWPYGGDNREKATDEFYILSTYGNFFAHLRAAEALTDQAGAEADRIYGKYQNDRAAFPIEERGEWAELVASVKVVTTDVGLRVTAGVFEVTGSRATASKVGLDRFWRDIRTHTLHDPVAYKNRELGRYVLLGEHPEPSWYT